MNFKKTVSIIICISMLLSIIVSAGGMEDDDYYTQEIGAGENLGYTIDEKKGILIIYGEGPMNDFNVWDERYYYYYVSPWVTHADQIETIIITDGVTSIGKSAFEDLVNVTTVIMSVSIEAIGYSAFYDCSSLGTVYYSGSEEEWNQIPIESRNDPLLNADKVFNYDMSEFENFVIGSGTCGENLNWTLHLNGTFTVSGTGDMTDYRYGYTAQPWESYVSYITNVVIEDGVTSIGIRAFANCANIETITLGNSVKSIGYYAFDGCDNINAIYAKDISSWCGIDVDVVDGYSYPINICKNIYIGGKLSTEFTSLVIPEGVTHIGDYAFAGWTNLTSVTIPDSVVSIGVYAFNGCSNITSLTIGSGVTSIDRYAFYGCYDLTDIYITDISKWCEITFDDYGSTLFSYCENLYINGELVTELVIPDGVTSISNYAFGYCNCITSVTIPGGVINIGDRAFYGCSNLSAVTIGNGVTSIGAGAFGDCSKLTSITIPASVEIIGNSAFPKNISITIDENNEYYSYDEQGVLFNKDNTVLIMYLDSGSSTYVIPDGVQIIDDSAFNGCSSLTSITLPDSIVSIGNRAFYDCSSLTSITIPDGVTSIGDYAFYECSSLTSVIIPDSVTSIGYGAFVFCENLTYAEINGGSIGERAFYYCENLLDVKIGDGVTSIGTNAFYYCSNLKSVTIDSGSIGNEAFEKCSSLETVIIGDGVTSIGGNAFSGCSSLTSLSIGKGVTRIGYYAFISCEKITDLYIKDVASWCGIDFQSQSSSPIYISENIYINGELVSELIIPEGVTNISAYAFFDFSSITSLTIPDSVVDVGHYAFYGCSNLSAVTIGNGVTHINYMTFNKCSSLMDVYYTGSEEEWNEISIDSYNDAIVKATKHFNHSVSETPIVPEFTTESGYAFNEEVGAVVAKPSAKGGESLDAFMSNIATAPEYVRVVDADGNVQTNVTKLITGYNVQLLFPDGSVAKTYAIVILGDIDRNGRLSISDISGVETAVATKPDKDTVEFLEANVDGNSRLSITDASALQSFIASGTWQ